MIDYSDVEEVIEKCFDELTEASRSKYDSDKADKTAALFLVAQVKISFIIEDIEMKAKSAKNEVSRIEGEKYFEYKTSSGDKKLTEATLSNHVVKDPDIFLVKQDCAKQEAALKKWQFILNTLKDSHVYFRNISKGKTWGE